MKQILQNLRSGEIELADVPCPMVQPGHLLVQATRTLISPGTERMLVEFSQAGLIGKARAQPEKVRQVLQKIRSDGLFPTLEVVFSRLDEPLPLGYCHVGRVLEVGHGVTGFAVGDRVISNGAHAEIVHVSATLAARIPDGVSDDCASFVVPGAIALQGIRLAEPTLGEDFVVIGLGLLGNLAIQLLRANGCNVLGIDTNESRCELARGLGFETVRAGDGVDVAGIAREHFGGGGSCGVDGVLITASSDSDAIVHQAAKMCRKRGRIVLVGVVGLNLRRADFYEKELSFQVSCSYGPGRYDPAYEQRGHDYPRPYVRWSAARNFEAVLNALATRRLDPEPMISRRVAQADASLAYAEVLKDPTVLGVVLQYPEGDANKSRVIEIGRAHGKKEHVDQPAQGCVPVVGVIGAGDFAKRVLLPAIRDAKVELRSVASAGGVSGLHAARKFGSAETTSDYRDILANEAINTVFISTRHNLHAPMVVEALRAGKHVFVEKPLAIDQAGLDSIREAHADSAGLHLMVGMNRRFAPHTQRAIELLSSRTQPIAMSVTVNAGVLPADHWLHDPAVGGGRLVGEGCHFIDLLTFLAGACPVRIQTTALQGAAPNLDSASIVLSFADGSVGVVQYWSNGPKSFPKERVEIFSEGRALVIDNWRELRVYGWPGASRLKTRQDKGHREELRRFIAAVAHGDDPLIPYCELHAVAAATLAAAASAGTGQAIDLTGGSTGQ